MAARTSQAGGQQCALNTQVPSAGAGVNTCTYVRMRAFLAVTRREQTRPARLEIAQTTRMFRSLAIVDTNRRARILRTGTRKVMRAQRFGASSSIVALLVGFSTAHAQDATGTGRATTTVEVGPNTAQTNAQGEIGVQSRAAVTPEEQLRAANDIARRANQLAERLSKMLDEARREKDIMRANCVNRKLTEVNANTRNVEQRMRALRDAAAAGDDARRGHEFTVLTVLNQKLDQLDQEAAQCLGQSVYEPGASQVITTISQGSPTLDPTVIDPASVAPTSITVPPPNLVEASPAS